MRKLRHEGKRPCQSFSIRGPSLTTQTANEMQAMPTCQVLVSPGLVRMEDSGVTCLGQSLAHMGTRERLCPVTELLGECLDVCVPAHSQRKKWIVRESVMPGVDRVAPTRACPHLVRMPNYEMCTCSSV